MSLVRNTHGDHGRRFIQEEVVETARSWRTGFSEVQDSGWRPTTRCDCPFSGFISRYCAATNSRSSCLQVSANAILIPEHADPSPTTAPPAPRPTADTSTLLPLGNPPTSSGTALRNFPKDNDKLSRISQMTASGQIANTREELADGSLWDRAYDALRNEEPERITAYEDLLSKALAGSQSFHSA